MLNWIKRHRLWTAIIVAILILATFVVASLLIPLIGEICSKDEYSGQKQCASYNVVLVALWRIIKAANDFGIAITALATVAVAAFTWTLWKTSDAQANLTRISIELAQAEFNATNRPQMDVRLIRFRGGFSKTSTLCVEWCVANTGRARGRIVESNSTLLIATEPLVAVPPYSKDISYMNGGWIDPGITASFNKTFTLGDDDFTALYVAKEDPGGGIIGSHMRIYFIGYVLYEGPDRQRRSVAFCRRYNYATDRFDVVEDPNYEHTA